ncbi:DUF1294 domain-containing protein [bacterium]|nr:DUF1294 domain-containing protein [bacterium]
MDLFLIYLIVINVVTFALFTIDFFIAVRRRDPDDGLMDGRLLCLFAVAGGAVGMLVALFVWTGRLGGRRMNKANIAWWFACFACLVVWGMVCAWRWGVVTIAASPHDLIDGWNVTTLRGVGAYLLAMNALAFFAFWLDKRRAERGGRRLPEATLLGLALLGGSLGGIAASRLFHHKTNRETKWYFRVGMPAFVVLHLALLVYCHLAGLV